MHKSAGPLCRAGFSGPISCFSVSDLARDLQSSAFSHMTLRLRHYRTMTNFRQLMSALCSRHPVMFVRILRCPDGPISAQALSALPLPKVSRRKRTRFRCFPKSAPSIGGHGNLDRKLWRLEGARSCQLPKFRIPRTAPCLHLRDRTLRSGTYPEHYR